VKSVCLKCVPTEQHGVTRHRRSGTRIGSLRSLVWTVLVALMAAVPLTADRAAAADASAPPWLLRPVVVAIDGPSPLDVLGKDADRRTIVAQLAQQINRAIALSPDRLIVLELRNAPLSFDQLDESSQAEIARSVRRMAPVHYENALSRIVAEALSIARRHNSDAKLSMKGLPLEAFDRSPGMSRAANGRYSVVLDQLDALVSWHVDVSSPPLDGQKEWEVLRLAAGRPILFRSKSRWQVLLDHQSTLSDRDAVMLASEDVATGLSAGGTDGMVGDEHWANDESGGNQPASDGGGAGAGTDDDAATGGSGGGSGGGGAGSGGGGGGGSGGGSGGLIVGPGLNPKVNAPPQGDPNDGDDGPQQQSDPDGSGDPDDPDGNGDPGDPDNPDDPEPIPGSQLRPPGVFSTINCFGGQHHLGLDCETWNGPDSCSEGIANGVRSQWRGLNAVNWLISEIESRMANGHTWIMLNRPMGGYPHNNVQGAAWETIPLYKRQQMQNQLKPFLEQTPDLMLGIFIGTQWCELDSLVTLGYLHGFDPLIPHEIEAWHAVVDPWHDIGVRWIVLDAASNAHKRPWVKRLVEYEDDLGRGIKITGEAIPRFEDGLWNSWYALLRFVEAPWNDHTNGNVPEGAEWYLQPDKGWWAENIANDPDDEDEWTAYLMSLMDRGYVLSSSHPAVLERALGGDDEDDDDGPQEAHAGYDGDRDERGEGGSIPLPAHGYDDQRRPGHPLHSPLAGGQNDPDAPAPLDIPDWPNPMGYHGHDVPLDPLPSMPDGPTEPIPGADQPDEDASGLTVIRLPATRGPALNTKPNSNLSDRPPSGSSGSPPSGQENDASEDSTGHDDEPVVFVHGMTFLPLDEDGWTTLAPSPDSRIVYVSSSRGSDLTGRWYAVDSAAVGENPFEPAGRIDAVRTLDHAYSLARDGHADWILLARGDQWSESVSAWTKSGRAIDERIVIGAYGPLELPRPRIRSMTIGTGSVRAAGASQPIENLAVIGVAFTGNLTVNAATVRDWLIEDCAIPRGLSPAIKLDAPIGATSDEELRLASIVIRRCVVPPNERITSSHLAHWLHATGVESMLIEQCLVGQTRWQGGEDEDGANNVHHVCGVEVLIESPQHGRTRSDLCELVSVP
jgi:uncharacterized membrane protein YgcG